MARASLKVLVVEDNPDHAQLIDLTAQEAQVTHFDIEHAGTLAAALARLETQRFDVVLLDLKLPDCSEMTGVHQIRERHPNIPVVVLTGNTAPSTWSDAIAQGAQDYLCKSNLTSETLERVLRYAVQRQQVLLELKRINDLLDERNRRLTGMVETAQQFVDNISHEFRTPLTVIKEFSAIIREGLAGSVSTQQYEFLDIISERVDDLAIMVDDMLDVSRLEAGMLRVWRQKSMVSDIFRRIRPTLERKATAKKVPLEVVAPGNLPAVFCDPEKVGRVVSNLVINAIKFCGDGRPVKLWAREDGKASEVVVGVTDGGAGIAPENLRLIFERFHQVEGAAHSSTKGFGLGLCIAKELADLNLSDIDVQSVLGQGSTFSFSIPFWNPREVLVRYLQRAQRGAESESQLTLTVVEAGESIESGVSNALDEFMHHAFRGRDLVLQILPYRWIVMTWCSEEEIEPMLARVRNELSETNRNRPGAKLPEIKLDVHGTWRVKSESQEILDACEAEVAPAEESSQEPYLLIVDDDTQLLRGLEIRLTAAGFNVVTAVDGETALEVIAKGNPDMILLDNFMPGIEGWEVLSRLKSDPATADIPVVMLSAGLRDQQKCLDLGASFFLQKPCDVKTIVAALREATAKPVLAGA
jgi:signal transduction histidine kinase